MGETAQIPAPGPGRANQKARTRAALVAAAIKLVREGLLLSIQDAAAEALVSVATAYRYFTSAEDLWEEASIQAIDLDAWLEDVHRRIEAAGDDPIARAEVAARLVGGRMLEDQLPFRLLVKAGLDRWLAQLDQQEPDGHMPVPGQAGGTRPTPWSSRLFETHSPPGNSSVSSAPWPWCRGPTRCSPSPTR